MKALNAWQDDRIHIVKGFFKDTIPAVAAQIKSISFLRLDGDLYRSTRDVLELLYFKIIANGLIYVDDYGSSAPIGPIKLLLSYNRSKFQCPLMTHNYQLLIFYMYVVCMYELYKWLCIYR